MSERPTPETDAETNYCDAMPNMPWVDAEVSRHLERERDEARELAQAFHNDQVTLLLERDEAREEWGKASMDAAQLLSEKTKVMAELDEAREKLSHLRACVFDALSALEAGAFEELKKAWEETK